MRSSISSLHSQPPNYLLSGGEDDPLLLREWILVLRGDGKSPRTIEGYTDTVRQLSKFLHSGGFPPVERATAEHLREWLGEMRSRGNKPATVNTRYRGAKAFYKWLLSEGEITQNPLDPIQPPRVPETTQPHYTTDEIALVLKSIASARSRKPDAARMKAIILTLFDTGLRAAELCGIKVDDVNWDNQTITVTSAKGGDARLVSIGTTATRAMLALLRSRRTESVWLFSRLDGNKLTRNALKLALRRTFDAAKVEFSGIHAFRRASGIEYLHQGGQAEDLRVLMGWRSPEMVRRYVKAAEMDRAAAAHKKFSPSDALESR